MRSLRLLSANTFLLSTLVLAQSTSLINSPVLSQPNAATQASISENHGKLPLSFEANHGQAGPQVKFLTRTSGYSLFLTGDEAVFALSGKMVKIRSPQGLKPASLTGADGTANAVPFPKTIYGTISDKNNVAADRITGGVLRMKLRNANPAAKVTGIDELAGTTNYFIGNDPAKWRTKVPTYAKVKYEGIYSGIDLVYYGNQRQLEYTSSWRQERTSIASRSMCAALKQSLRMPTETSSSK